MTWFAALDLASSLRGDPVVTQWLREQDCSLTASSRHAAPADRHAPLKAVVSGAAHKAPLDYFADELDALAREPDLAILDHPSRFSLTI